MTASVAIPEKRALAVSLGKDTAPKRVTWEQFEKEYLSREDRYKYEWVNGLIEKTERTMNQYQDLLADNLIEFFYRLKFQGKVSGRLTKEVDTFFLPKIHRRPDMLWFSDEQSLMIADGENQVPSFVIEIISKRDQINPVKKKLKDYEDAGVQVVWLIFPELLEIEVHKGSKIEVFRGEKEVNADPVMPAFKLKVSQVFAKPTKP